jgi:hypothetical protein
VLADAPVLPCTCDAPAEVFPCRSFKALLELASTDTSENRTTISSTCSPPLGVGFALDAGVALVLVGSLVFVAVDAGLLEPLGVLLALGVDSAGALEPAGAPWVTSCANT